MEEKFEELYKDFKRVDLKHNKVMERYKTEPSDKGNFYIDENNLYPSANILDEDNKDYYEQFYDFDLETIKDLDIKALEITPAKISNGSIEKGSIKVKEKEETIEEPTEQVVEEPKVEPDEKLEESRRTALFILDNFKEKTPEFDKETRERILECQDLESLRIEIMNLNNYIAMDAKMREKTEEFAEAAKKDDTAKVETSTSNDATTGETTTTTEEVKDNSEELKEPTTEVGEETIEEITEQVVEEPKEEIKNDISFDYYGKTEIENIKKDLMNNITDLRYSILEQKKKIEVKKQKLEAEFNPMNVLDPEWAKTRNKLDEERYRLNRIDNLMNGENYKALLEIENAINSITIEHNIDTKRYHFTSGINPYELSKKTAELLSKISEEIKTQNLGSKKFEESIDNKIQTINNNMKNLYSKMGFTASYSDIKTIDDMISYLENQIADWKDLEKIQGKSYEKEINEALYEIEVISDIKTRYGKINYLKNQINHWKDLEKIQGKSYEKEINEALYEIEVIKNTIKSLINNLPEESKTKITNIDEIKSIIEDIENKKEEEKETLEETYSDREEIIETIKGIVSSIDSSMSEEKINEIFNKIENLLIGLNKMDQKVFEEKYNNAKTEEEKEKLIKDRENQVESYRDLLKHDDKEIEKQLGDRFNPLIDKFKNEIIKDKDKSDDTNKNPETPEDDKEKTDEPPKKGRLKVIAKKALKWMKEHKLATIAIGLALTTLLIYTGVPQFQMMINSALWNVGSKLGWGASTLGKLHSTNLGLSKTIANGAYIFEEVSGAYTLGGAAGAQALYGAGAANLVGALTGLVGLGGIGGVATVATSIIKKIKNRKKKEEEPEKVTPIENKVEEKEETVEETKGKDKEIEKENEKSTTVENDKEEKKATSLTREQTVEMFKELLEEERKKTSEKMDELMQKLIEKDKKIAELEAELERLKAQGLNPEELTEEIEERKLGK